MNCPHCGRDIFVGSVWQSAERERLAREYARNFYDSQMWQGLGALAWQEDERARLAQKTLLAWRAAMPGWFEPQSEWEKMP